MLFILKKKQNFHYNLNSQTHQLSSFLLLKFSYILIFFNTTLINNNPLKA